MVKRSSVLSQVNTTQLLKIAHDLPERPGVYYFLNEQNYPIYIGKSINLKQRVLSHLYAANKDSKENKIARATVTIDFKTTAGELGALLLESHEVKRLLPLYNRQLRRQKKLFALQLDQNTSYHSLAVADLEWPPGDGQTLYGPFVSKRKAKQRLDEIATTASLCKRVIGLEQVKQNCFAYELKRCDGACMGLESATSHNDRLATALSQQLLTPWPYPGPVAVVEGGADAGYLLDHWNYYGTFSIAALEQMGAIIDALDINDCQTLDRDTYRILVRYLEKHQSDIKLIHLEKVKHSRRAYSNTEGIE